jgi:hypothetical protein
VHITSSRGNMHLTHARTSPFRSTVSRIDSGV